MGVRTSRKLWSIAAGLVLLALPLGLIAVRRRMAPASFGTPFDVGAFLDESLFGAERAPAAYRKAFPLVELLNRAHPAAFDDPSRPRGNPEQILADSAASAAQLVQAAALPPGFWHDPRTVNIRTLDNSEARSAGRLLLGRANLLLASGRPEESARLLLATLQLGRHSAYRGLAQDSLVGIANETAGMYALQEWAVQKSVSPEMVLHTLAAWRVLEPGPPRASDTFKCEYLSAIRGLRDPFSFGAPPGPPSFGDRAGRFLRDLSGVTGERPVQVLSALIADRLTWCDLPAWKRRQWTMSVSGPNELPPKVPGVHLTRAQLDALVNGSPLVKLLAPSFGSVDRAFDRIARMRADLEANLALAAYSKRFGRYPRRAADLVPDYLPVLPTDPATGHPLDVLTETQDSRAGDHR